ncbi:MAG: virulence factor [Anaerolineales bacterium]
MSRRRRNGTQYQIVYWCDIPAQVKVRQGRNRISKPLPNRFQDAIDRAAIEAGKIGTNGYLSGWRTSEWQDHDGDVDAVAEHLVAELDAAYPRERLRTMIKQYGYDHV